jgi:hypothetical protein
MLIIVMYAFNQFVSGLHSVVKSEAHRAETTKKSRDVVHSEKESTD